MRPRLSPDGSTVFFSGRDWSEAQGVWSVPASGGQACNLENQICEDIPLPPPRLIVEFDSPSFVLYGTGISVGPDSIYLSIAEYESDIWVMDLDWED